MAAEPPNQLEIAILLGVLASATGDPEAAEDQPRSAIDDVRRLGVLDRLMEPTAALARLQLDQGAADLAREMTANPVRTITEKEIWIWGTDVVPIRIQALLATNAHEQAVALTESFGRGIRGRTAPGPKAALTLCRAMLAEANGDHPRAANLFGRSAAAWQNLPRPYETLLARERQGRSLLAAGKADTGLAVLLDARQRMADLGAHPHVERVGRTLRAHGIKDLPRPGRKHRGRRGYGDQLSPREIEVVRQLMAGGTNRDIAEALCRSPKTVATQLNSAMRKLKVSSRTALVVSAIESGVIPGGRIEPSPIIRSFD